MSEILSCHGVSKHYGGVTALKGVDLTVSGGEILGLVGANGAGKSTLIDIISGVQEPSFGHIEMLGRKLQGRASGRARQGLARTFQQPQVAMDLTLRENIACGLAAVHMASLPRLLALGLRSAFGGKMPGEGAIESIAEVLGLQDLDRLTEEASFGELRLVEVARALIQQPRCIMLDEPFPGVDSESMAGVIEALRTLRSMGHAVLLVDHNVDVVISVVDRIALLSDGEVAVEGDVDACVASETFRSRYIGVA